MPFICIDIKDALNLYSELGTHNAHLHNDYLASLKKLTIIDLNLVKSVDLVNELPAYLVIAASSVDSITILTIRGNNT